MRSLARLAVSAIGTTMGGVLALSMASSPAHSVNPESRNAEAVSDFCGVDDFYYFHYSTSNPHYDRYDFLQAYNLNGRRWHSWWNVTDDWAKTVDCGPARY